MPKPKQETRLIEVDPLRRVWIYMIVDRGTGKIIYIGQSVDTGRRWKSHINKMDTGLQEYCLRKSCRFDRLKIVIVSQLPNGVAQCDADRFEAYFIAIHNTVFHMINNREVANNTNGNRARNVDPESTAQEIEIGYVWPKAMEKKVEKLKQASPELEEARALVDVLETIIVQNPKIEDEVRTELVIAETQKSKLEMGAYQRACVAFQEYEAMPSYASVPRSDVVAQLNGIKELDKSDVALQKQCNKVWLRILHTDKGDAPVGAGQAMFVMGVVKEWIGEQAESNLNLDTAAAKRCLELREWSSKNEGRVPSQAAMKREAKEGETAEDLKNEDSLGQWINHWRGAYGRPSPNTVLVLLRHYPALITRFFEESRSDKSDAITKELNSKLRAGFGDLHESEADTTIQKLPCTSTTSNPNARKVYRKLNHFLDGGNASEADNILEGLQEERADRLRKRHEDKVEEYEKKMKERIQKKTELGHKRRVEMKENENAKKAKA